MKKVYIIAIIIGLMIAGCSTYSWYSSKQAVYHLTEEKNRTSIGIEAQTNLDNKMISESEFKAKALYKVEEIVIPDTPIMSDQLQRYKAGENIAELRIPVLEQGYSVFWGTDDNTLEKGVGMYVSQWTTTPDQFRHTVLSGHRDTVFTKLGSVKKGDEINLKYDGKQYNYTVKDFWITDPEDRTVIVKKDKPTLTLTTCYPFNYIGNAPKRYIIQAELESITGL